MDIQQAHQNWTQLAKDDPMWIVLTDPEKRGGKWDPDQFFQNGREEISKAMQALAEAGIVVQRGKTLDFGCGIGRLSQGLANYFSSVDGVDISASMIERAQSLNRFPEKVHFHLNLEADLRAFPSATYDFVFTRICLQHIPPQYQLSYISEFLRLLKPGGVADFQTIHARGLRALVPDFFTEAYRKFKNRGRPFIPMYGVPADRVLDTVRAAGSVVKKRVVIPYQGWEGRYGNDFFVVAKQSN